MDVFIKRIRGTELYLDGEPAPQRCFVELNCLTGELSARAIPQACEPIREDIRLGHIQPWGIPALKAEAANKLLVEIAPIAEAVVAGYSVYREQGVDQGVLSDDALISCSRIDDLTSIGALYSPDQCLQLVKASDYFAGMTASDFAITANTTDERLAEHASVEARTALGADGVDVIVGLLDYLRGLRDSLR